MTKNFLRYRIFATSKNAANIQHGIQNILSNYINHVYYTFDLYRLENLKSLDN